MDEDLDEVSYLLLYLERRFLSSDLQCNAFAFAPSQGSAFSEEQSQYSEEQSQYSEEQSQYSDEGEGEVSNK